jgi:predicted  nucleic acid-binding Zn-ribbon protein
MLPDLERLIALQRLDSRAQEANRLLADEPAREQAFALRLETLRQKVTAAKELLADNQTARRAIEKDVAVHQGRLSKYSDQLMAVKTNVEYQAMQKEIEFAKAEVKALEDKILERMMEADELTGTVKQTEADLAAGQKTVDADRKLLAVQITEQRAALDEVTGARATLVAALDARVLALFELVSKRRNGVAVAEARDGICTICHVRLRPQVFNTVRRNEEILQCDSCSRILYFNPVVSAPAAPAESPSPQAAS